MHDLETIKLNHSQLTRETITNSKSKKRDTKVRKFNKKKNENE